jgi:hypothetical protein
MKAGLILALGGLAALSYKARLDGTAFQGSGEGGLGAGHLLRALTVDEEEHYPLPRPPYRSGSPPSLRCLRWAPPRTSSTPP